MIHLLSDTLLGHTCLISLRAKLPLKFLCADLLFFLVMLQCLNDCFVGMFFACAEFFLVKLLTHMEDFSVTACGVSDNKTTGEDKIAFISKKMFIKTTRLYEKSMHLPLELHVHVYPRLVC